MCGIEINRGEGLPMPGFRNMSCRARFLLALLLVAAVLVVACSSRHEVPTGKGIPSSGTQDSTGVVGDTTPADGTGVLGLQLTLPGGEHFSVLNYTLTNGTNTRSGSSNISGGGSVNILLVGVPAGSGYALALTSTSDDGAVLCAFPAPGDPVVSNITLANQMTTVISVNLQCLSTVGMDSGSLAVSGTTSYCARWTSIVGNPGGASDGGSGTTAYPGMDAAPANIGVGQSLVLVASATAPDPSQLSFGWAASGGSLSSSTGTITQSANDAGATDQTTFTCPSAPGAVVISLSVSDGPLPEGGSCDTNFTQGSVTVNCQAAPACDSGAGCNDAGSSDGEAGDGANDSGDAADGDDGG
jgi:hypothetical protein